ncbi:MAG: ATP-binding protein, partial [Pseudolabrys sp.]
HGTGRGLTITRTIVQTFGGRVWAENRPGGGALFRFILPLSKTAQAPRAN